jgi:hypothetical protein
MNCSFGKTESVKLAFADILKLDRKLELRQDIIEVAVKHCIYLEQFPQELTEEELAFMTYVKEVEEADEFTKKIFEWQNLQEMLTWLKNS